MNYQDIVDFILQLEGPYRWYVIGAILIILTAVITRFIFNTLKWFFMLAAVAVIIIALIHYLTPINIFQTLP